MQVHDVKVGPGPQDFLHTQTYAPTPSNSENSMSGGTTVGTKASTLAPAHAAMSADAMGASSAGEDHAPLSN